MTDDLVDFTFDCDNGDVITVCGVSQTPGYHLVLVTPTTGNEYLSYRVSGHLRQLKETPRVV